MNKLNTSLALAGLDELMAGLKEGDEDAVERARELLHIIIDDSNSSQLWVILTPIQILFEREINPGGWDEN